MSEEKYMLECVNPMCGWSGFNTDCKITEFGLVYGYKCPKCGHDCEPQKDVL